MGTTAQKLEYLSETAALLKTAVQSKLSGYITFDTQKLREIVGYVERILNEPKTAIAEAEFRNLATLTGIVIPGTVTTIGKNAFANCTGLFSLTIGSGVTSIGDYAFSSCSHIEEVTLGSGVATIGKSAFSRCSALRSFSFGTAPVTSVDTYTFQYAGLTSIEVPATLAQIPTGFCFSCSSLSSVVIQSGVRYIGAQAFQGCNLQQVILPDSVIALNGSYVFLNNAALVSIEIGTGITRIGASSFSHTEDRPNFQSITIKATTPPSLANTEVFQNTGGCPIYVPAGSVEAYKTATNWTTYASRIQAIPE